MGPTHPPLASSDVRQEIRVTLDEFLPVLQHGCLDRELVGAEDGLAAHHGQLVATSRMEEACVLAIFIERAAKLQLMAEAVAPIKPLDPDDISLIEYKTRPDLPDDV